MFEMKKCPKCGKYSLKQKCEPCASENEIAHPPKFSIEDKYAKYRRIVLLERLKKSA
jgi:H/ACA ribonucleoprotein complex subunit 3